MAYTVEDCPNLHCRDCKYFNHGSRNPFDTCKRINGTSIKFYIPPLSPFAYENHMPCKAFEPRSRELKLYADYKPWEGFDQYWEIYKQVWLKDCDKKFIAITAEKYPNWIYYVKTEDFMNGTMYENGKLKAVKRWTLKKCRESERNPIGYRPVTEILEGMNVLDLPEV